MSRSLACIPLFVFDGGGPSVWGSHVLFGLGVYAADFFFSSRARMFCVGPRFASAFAASNASWASPVLGYDPELDAQPIWRRLGYASISDYLFADV